MKPHVIARGKTLKRRISRSDRFLFGRKFEHGSHKKSGRSFAIGAESVKSKFLRIGPYQNLANFQPWSKIHVSTPGRLWRSRMVEDFLRVCAAFPAENGRIAICGDRTKLCWRAPDSSLRTKTRTRTPPTVTKIWQRHRGPKNVLLARR